MSDARAEARAIVNRLVAAYNTKEREALVALYAPDARYWSALGGWHDGVEAVSAHFEHLFRTLPDERMAITRLATDGEVAIAEFRSSGTTDDTPYELDFTEVFTLLEGRITEARVYLDPEALPGA